MFYKDCHIDHAIPLEAVHTPENRSRLKSDYALDSDFDFDDFENWIPACPGCNLRKSSTTFEPSPVFLMLLNDGRRKAGLARAIADKLTTDTRKSLTLVRLKTALDKGDVTETEIRELLRGLPVMVQKSVESPAQSLWLAPGWQIVEEQGDLVFVGTPGGRVGYTSKSNHSSWVCSSCGHKGPWNGVICLSCGRMSDPGD